MMIPESVEHWSSTWVDWFLKNGFTGDHESFDGTRVNTITGEDFILSFPYTPWEIFRNYQRYIFVVIFF